MNFETTLFKSKVAKRILTLFVLSAIIPISITGYFSYNFVINLLSDQKQTQLDTKSKSYGMTVFDRLEVAESQFITLTNNYEKLEKLEILTGNVFFEDAKINTNLLNNIKLYSERSFENLDHTNIDHMLDGNTLLSVRENRSNSSIIFSRIIATRDSELLITAEVDSNYVFGDMDIFAGNEDVCVLTKSLILLVCSDDKFNKLSLPSFNKNINKNNDSSMLQINDEEYLFSSWELFLKGTFNSKGWLIYYTSPQDSIYTQIKSFGTILIPLLLLSILMVSLVSFNQISKILIPLDTLNRLTKKIAKRDFSDTTNFDTNDEFQNLGESFNLMSEELSRQFNVMTAMSNLDRAILTKMNKESVVKAIFNNLEEYIEYSYASMILLEHNDSNGVVYIYGKKNKNIKSKSNILINNCDIQTLFQSSDYFVSTVKRENTESIRWLKEVYSNYITSLAIRQNSKLIAILIIGHQYSPKLDDESLNQLKNYTDRIKVALKAIERERTLIKQAKYDGLTKLPNRESIVEKFDLMTKKNTHLKIAVLFIDLDRFKVVNDSQGHAIGDKLLIEVSKRIKYCVKKQGIVARYGGDEFIVLLPLNEDSSNVTQVADQIIQSLSTIFTIDNYEQFIGASIGISMYPKDGDNWTELLQKSDIAMYKSKLNGRNKYSFFSQAMQEDVQEKAILEADLFHAIEKNEVYMVYQSQIDVATGKVTGAESLMRWNHYKIGNIPPDQFITYAEDNGFIIQLGTWALREVLRHCQQWQFEHQALPKIAVNISARQLKHDNFIPDVENLIHDFDIGKTNIEFEITESLFLSNDENIVNKLKKLNKMGVSISIDDFGKGYSSLSYLKKLPVQTLKIDKSFINDIATDTDSKSIVHAIISMAKSLNKNVIAEGVETLEQLQILKDLGCDCAQGYLIGKPKTADKMSNESKTAIISLNELRSSSKTHFKAI